MRHPPNASHLVPSISEKSPPNPSSYKLLNMNNEDENSTRKECPICLDSLYYHQVSSLNYSGHVKVSIPNVAIIPKGLLGYMHLQIIPKRNQQQPGPLKSSRRIEIDVLSTTNAHCGSTNPIAQPAATRASKQNRRTSTTNAQSGSTNPIAATSGNQALKRNRHTSTTNAQSGIN
ncbi:hypothetical protein Pst134EA_032536 [Puccinia striiformis f. sp. tritici]|uniref:uncharacterized protein n=1 Tax=Puccinia striiformis f. sp. tritici TaxID=168172 RepID=UPI002008A89D|nr:uncharacterized protein Pst134EA_032536 [Puccinia striiformis f. sp. tritici]KAH9441717.1 hypothetical protein Pst134EA_032536 [Puccinia striiformis f. sp. tritici]